MRVIKIIIHLLKDIQIQSALVWAIALLACMYFTKNENVSLVLTTAAGLHLVMLNRFLKSNLSSKQNHESCS